MNYFASAIKEKVAGTSADPVSGGGCAEVAG